MKLAHQPKRWLRGAARWGLALSMSAPSGICLAEPPPGAYGPAADVQTLPRATPVPAQPGTRIPALATIGFADNQQPQPILINLPTALRLANASNPTIALAQARVQEAYARLQEARVMWLPDLAAGPAYVRHDGLLQTSTGNVLSVNKWNFFTGGQAELAVDTSQAFFGPLVARQLVQAQAAGARATQFQIQLDVANAYLDLLHAYGALAINRETLSKTEDMYERARTVDRAGVAMYTSDLPRAAAAVEFRRQQRMQAQAQVVTASSHLIRLLFLDPTVDLQPADLTVLPIELVPADMAVGQLVSLGLMNRPEMAQSRFLVGAADAQYRQTRLAPLLPRLDVSYSAGEFGGGIDDSTMRWGGRGDATAQATWQLHNFGLGDLARVRAQRAVTNQAMAHVLEIQAEVGDEVAGAAKTVGVIHQQLQDDENGVRQAEEMWTRLEKADFGVANNKVGHLEVLQPLTAIDQLQLARTAYLDDVIAYDRAQFQLYWAMGQPPICSLPSATAIPTQLPVRPTAAQMARPEHGRPSEPLPPPRKVSP